jgi:undecaprenyl-diphosphatase
MAYPSGTTIKISLLYGWIREISSRFSFLLANPNSTVAANARLLGVASRETVINWSAFLVGGVASLARALTAIHFYLKCRSQSGIWPYVIYRIILLGRIRFIFLT